MRVEYDKIGEMENKTLLSTGLSVCLYTNYILGTPYIIFLHFFCHAIYIPCLFLFYMRLLLLSAYPTWCGPGNSLHTGFAL